MINPEHSVLITGASSGIGRATALHLHGEGYQVFAGLRGTPDPELMAAAARGRLHPVKLDVTDPASIEAALGTMEEAAPTGGFSLVNNAGVSANGPLELLELDQIREIIDVNLFGLLAVTRAFIPLLRQRKGRLINVGSGHGKLAVPDKSVYAASKFAVGAVSDALRTELLPFGVSVVNLVVGKVDTAVLGKIEAERKAMLERSDPSIAALYSPLLEFFDRQVRTIRGIPPEEVARCIAGALRAGKPRGEYLIGPGAKKMRNLARLPMGLRDTLMAKALYGKGR
jgi:NAD(P)-dependent dehydrogenase (short-subunit alcohol dehydrogenase family)